MKRAVIASVLLSLIACHSGSPLVIIHGVTGRVPYGVDFELRPDRTMTTWYLEKRIVGRVGSEAVWTELLAALSDPNLRSDLKATSEAESDRYHTMTLDFDLPDFDGVVESERMSGSVLRLARAIEAAAIDAFGDDHNVVMLYRCSAFGKIRADGAIQQCW